MAIEKLDSIRESDWLEEGEIKTFHVAVSEAFREYLGGRYGFDSLEMTTEELTSLLETATLRGISMVELGRFLRDTDLVKFAKWRPSIELSEELLERAYDIVRRTTAAERAWDVKSSIPRSRRSASHQRRSRTAADSSDVKRKADEVREAPVEPEREEPAEREADEVREAPVEPERREPAEREVTDDSEERGER